MSTPWIKLTRVKGSKIPTFTHPVTGEIITALKSKMNVRWPNGDVGPADIVVAQVNVLGSDEKGTYIYIEVPFNGMTVIYNLDEVELLADELSKPVVKRGKAA
jgi:hypothetical protein